MPTLTAPDGTLLVYDMYEAAAPRAAILALHGWADHAGRWRDVGERLCAAGYSTYVLDLRGHGRSGGRRGHLSRFSQLLGDLQAFRRVVRLRTDRPQLLLGTSFGGLVALRYLETQPSDPIAGAVVVSPWLGLAFRPPAWKRFVGRVFADLWPTLPVPARLDADTLSRDPVVNEAYAADPAVHGLMTPGAWREIQWAQRAVPARLSSCLIALSGDELRPGQPKRRISDGTPIAHEAQDHERQARATAAPRAAGGLRIRGVDRAVGGGGRPSRGRARGHEGQVPPAGRRIRQLQEALGQRTHGSVAASAGRSDTTPGRCARRFGALRARRSGANRRQDDPRRCGHGGTKDVEGARGGGGHAGRSGGSAV